MCELKSPLIDELSVSKEPMMVSIDDEKELNDTEPLNIPSFHVGTPLTVTSVLLSVSSVDGSPPPTVAVT